MDVTGGARMRNSRKQQSGSHRHGNLIEAEYTLEERWVRPYCGGRDETTAAHFTASSAASDSAPRKGCRIDLYV